MPILQKYIIIGIAAMATAALSTAVSAGQRQHHDNGHNNPRHSYPGHNYPGSYDQGHNNPYNNNSKVYVFAKVIRVKPLYKRVRVVLPRKECSDQHATRPITREVHAKSAGNAVMGGIIGGVIGHQVGGRNKDVATITGALLGAAIGHDSGRRTVNTGEYRTEHNQRCDTQVEYRYEDRPDGYQVTYLHRGEIYHIRKRRHPGDRLRIEVQISLADS